VSNAAAVAETRPAKPSASRRTGDPFAEFVEQASRRFGVPGHEFGRLARWSILWTDPRILCHRQSGTHVDREIVTMQGGTTSLTGSESFDPGLIFPYRLGLKVAEHTLRSRRKSNRCTFKRPTAQLRSYRTMARIVVAIAPFV
jgi:hypothetical protein